jgi:hypothetical protein
LALSAIYVDEALLQPLPTAAADADTFDDDEDAYFNDDQEDGSGNRAASESSKGAVRARAWLAGVEALKDTYVAAGMQLQGRMRGANNEIERVDIEEIDLDTLLAMAEEEVEGEGEGEGEEGGRERGSGDGEQGGVFSDISAHMMNVITEAYCSQLGEGIEGLNTGGAAAQPKVVTYHSLTV